MQLCLALSSQQPYSTSNLHANLDSTSSLAKKTIGVNIIVLEKSELERYYCRLDKRGIIYDRKAMKTALKELGHNRINVIAGHYLW